MPRVVGDSFGGGRYRLLERVGQGGVGAVYRAEQQPLGREVALKILRPEYTAHPGVRSRFSREARAVAMLSHPSIASIFDFGAETDGTLFLAMEFVRGLPLSALMARGLPVAHLVALLDPILGALAHAHARGVLHRDLKPDNMLVGFVPGTDRPPTPAEIARWPELIKLVDFGIATAWGVFAPASASQTHDGEVVGTPLYMSPEQARGERALTPGVDIYTIGVLLFEGLTGRHPFAGLEPDETPMDVMVRHITAPVPELTPPPGVTLPEALKAVVRRCLSKRPEGRFQSAAALREALREAAILLHALDEDDEASSGEPTSIPVVAPLVSRISTAPEAQAPPLVKTPAEAVSAAIAPEVRFDVPLVAREAERQQLDALARQCLAEQVGRIVLLSGEAGVGKTKLASWLKERMVETGRMRGITGAFLKEGGGLRGVREVVESLFGVRHMSRERVRVRLAEVVEAWGDVDLQDAQALTAFLRPEEADRALSQAGQPALFALLVRVLERASREHPLMILLDDVQWAASELGALLEYLAVEFRYRSASIFIVCTIRTEDLAANAGLDAGLRRLSRYDGETVLRLQLSRMSAEDSGSLVREIMPADAALQQVIVDRSSGNPLHVVQLLQYLLQQGTLIWDPGRGVFDGGPDEAALREVPPSLGDLIGLRLSLLEAVHQTDGMLERLLERCSVLGDTFAYELLEEMLTLEGDAALLAFVERGADILLSASVLTPREGRQDSLRFGHGLIREVLLARLSGRPRLKRLHSLAGRAKERHYSHRIDVVADAIAHHALEAAEHQRALDFLLRAACAARAGHRLSRAEGLFVDAAAVARGLLDRDDALHLKLARRIGDLRYQQGDFEGAEVAYVGLLRLALLEGDQPNASGEPLIGDELRALIDALERAPGLSLPKGDPLEGDPLAGDPLEGDPSRTEAIEAILRALYGLARLMRHHGQQDLAEALAICGEGLARRSGPDLQIWAATGVLLQGWLAWERGDYDEADRLGASALEASEGGHNRAEALHLMAEVARRRGDPARTAELLVQAREVYEVLDDRRNAALCLRDLALLARARQDLENAARLFNEARRRFEVIGDRHAVATSLNGLGEVARFLGRLEVAEGCYQKAFETFRSLGARADAATSLANLGLTAMAGGDLAAAERSLMHAEDFIADLSHPYISVGLHINLALLRALQDRWEDADGYLALALDASASLGVSDPDYARPLQKLGELLKQLGRDDQGDLLLARAQAMWTHLS